MFAQYRWSRWPLAIKTTTIVVLLIILSVGSITLLSINREQRNFHSEQEQQANSTLSSISAVSIDPLYFFRTGQIREAARSLQEASPTVQLVHFYDPQGRIIAATFIRENGEIASAVGGDVNEGSYQPDPFGQRLLAGNTIILEWHSDHLRSGQPITVGNQQLGGVRVDFSTTALQGKLAAVRNQGIMVAIIVIIIGAISASLLSRSIVGPIHQLAEASQAMAQGDLDQHVSVKTQDELAVLADNFNEMAGKLRENINELKALNIDLDQRVTQRTAELEAINSELESFSYSVSHDLRAPLRSINGFSKRLLENYQDNLPPEANHYLTRVHASSVKMGQLIDDLLNLSRIGRSKMRISQVDLTKMAKDIMSELRESEPHRNIHFEVREGIVVQGDTSLLRIALRNLLSNAWKYSRECDPAQIQLGKTSRNGNEIYFIRDNGVGFDMAYVDKLFGAFQRLHDARKYEGTGIGLATVKRIIDRHGGEIWATGKVNEGATFSFILNDEMKESANDNK